LGMMVPRRDTLPALPLCFSRSKMSRSIVYLLPVVDDCLHRIGFRNQTAVVTIQTIGPSPIINPLLGKFEPVLPRLLRCFGADNVPSALILFPLIGVASSEGG
jgi:hypothetical protein